MIPKIYFKLYKQYYISGNYIDGELIIHNPTYIGINTLKINFIGTINDKIDDLNNLDLFDYNLYEYLINSNYEYCFYDNKLYKIKNNKNKTFILLKPGIHTFKIKIPISNKNLPQSYNDEKYNIEYKLKFDLNFINIITSNMKNIYYNKKINIIPLIYTFDKELNIPFITPNIKTLMINKRNYFICSAFIPYRGYVKNDIIKLYIKILNYTNINLNKLIIDIKLREKIKVPKILNYVFKNVSYSEKKKNNYIKQ